MSHSMTHQPYASEFPPDLNENQTVLAWVLVEEQLEGIIHISHLLLSAVSSELVAHALHKKCCVGLVMKQKLKKKPCHALLNLMQ